MLVWISVVYVYITLSTQPAPYMSSTRDKPLVYVIYRVSNTRATATMVHHRFLLVTYPIQGHINPTIQFAKRLVAIGVHVTFVISFNLYRRMLNKPTIHGLSFAPFSDGYDDGYNSSDDFDVMNYMLELKRRGAEFLRNTIAAAAEEGHPFTCVTYTLLLAWAAKVAREFHIPGTLLWIQPATVFDIYYHYFHEYGDYISDKSKDPTCSSIELPGLPFSLTARDLPSFLLPSNTYRFALPSFEEQLQELDQETNPRVLVNTFEELEPEALKAIDKFTMVPIGPLIPSAFLDGKDPSDTSFGGDIFHASNDDLEWLDSKPEFSVVYVSFGTIAVLPKRQMEEIARALLDSGCSFLWVIREKTKEGEEQREKGEELSCREELEKRGKIVKWCSQVEVLSHASLGCFVTHCGWNSTMESLASGVPMVAFPQWTDQTTNAKVIQDVWKTGVRIDDKVNEEGIVEAREIRRCLEVVMGSGEKGEDLRRNAKKWKYLAREAVKEGGSSDRNMRCFVDDVGKYVQGSFM
ncbi:crocetin glucosyltransferase, chloroplastic-like [Abrus precatorius]|uniref:Glycosyltransferase n=1 Tax=Abrus precatorius TaxID=3816 RepID=A0A8B8K051_ABRPR|nr:crocetin glucosyltransferase, chloroplastic-like [Abrus precatorius]